ncbi:Monocarboxylate transporter 10 [Camponotus floridanus]|uniref:Monocarboxylate transporter 10 n=1 Tax=Camponotus floridanus TaxID=104421 RepID=E1ZWV6_CAMFO|nr:Monocarboxylate transporter 10 [Camponotus floridanus]
MKNRVQSPVYEDSGVAISGELGEPSFSGECEGIVSLQAPKEIEENANPDPRFDMILEFYVRYAAQCTIRQHYYPENCWGWIIVVTGVMVQIITTGIQGAAGAWLLLDGTKRYRQTLLNVGWLGAMSTGVALLVSPVTIAFCRRKSTRVTAVLGGLVTALGCLFTSFASQFHQLFFSYGTVVGIGVGMTRDCSTLMVAQYFKRKRELVEIFIVSGSGLGIAVMSAFIKGAITKIGWRLGLQAVTGVVFLTFILGTFYRSASLYHPQRRAILHLKNQKRKIKDKNKADDRPPFFDFSTLKSKTVRILLVSTGISAFGINTPIFYLAHQVEEEGLGDAVVLLQAYLGLAWTLGCIAFGLLVVHRSVECRIARQYLTQAAVFVCGLCILALTAVQGNYHGYVIFAWIYGIFCGGYHYSLKMYTYERVRARNFAKTWGFVQCSQAIPIAIGVPISGYINVGCGGKAGYYFSSTCVLVGSFTLFFIDLHRRNLSKHKHKVNGTKHTCVSDNCPQRRKPSFSQEPENVLVTSFDFYFSRSYSEASALLESDARAGIAGRARNLRHDVQRKISRLRQDRASSEAFPCSASSVESLPSGSGSSTQALVRAGSNHSSISCEDRDAISPTSIGPVLCRARALVDYTPSPYDKDVLKFKVREAIDVLGTNKPELTCISEEGIADMDLPDNLLEDLDYIGDCITSCNKVENYLMLSEFENNLIAEMPIIMDRRGRRWSLARSKTGQSNCGQTSGVQLTADEEEVKSKWRFTNVPSNANTRMITVIDEASA